MKNFLYVHKYCEVSRINGYGIRSVVWTQGCSIKCEGCFNSETHSNLNGGIYIEPVVLGEKLGKNSIDGLTITGGEPLDQPYEVIKLINSFKKHNKGTVFLFTGYDIDNILKSDIKKKFINLCDVIIAGPYINSSSNKGKWKNKNIIITNKKLSIDDILPKYDIELTVNNEDIIITGYPNKNDIDNLKDLFFSIRSD